MNRLQSFHEVLIPLLVEAMGVTTYLELGTDQNQTIGKVRCPRRIGVDKAAALCEGAIMFSMPIQAFIGEKAGSLAPFQFVFIDADHSAESVGQDFRGIWPFVEDEGLVVLHDTNPETESDTDPGLCGDAWKFAHDLWLRQHHDCYESLTLPYHPGLTLVRKRVSWGPPAKFADGKHTSLTEQGR